MRNCHYHVEETGQGEPLLLLHGFTGSTRSWDGVAPQLAQRYRVIRVDLPGHGKTEVSPDVLRYTMPSVGQDLAHLLVTHNAAPAHVLGYSMGGRLALFFALNFPQHVRTLIVESGSPGLATEAERAARRASDDALTARIERDGIEAFINEWEQLPLWTTQANLPAETKRHQRDIRLGSDPHGLALSLRGMGTGAQPSLWDMLPSLVPPTKFIAGDLDAKFVTIAREMHARVPQSKLHLVANAGHTTHLEQPQAFLDAVFNR